MDENFLEVRKNTKKEDPLKIPTANSCDIFPFLWGPREGGGKISNGLPKSNPPPKPLKEEEATGFMVRYTENQSVKAPKPTSSRGAF